MTTITTTKARTAQTFTSSVLFTSLLYIYYALDGSPLNMREVQNRRGPNFLSNVIKLCQILFSLFCNLHYPSQDH